MWLSTQKGKKTMKKLLTILLACFTAFSLVACSSKKDEPTPTDTTEPVVESEYKIAMVTDYGDITDQSFNQSTYEACRDFAEENSIQFNYFKPAGDSTPERVAMIESAIDEGYNVIVTPGFAFAAALVEVAPLYPDVKFVALDVAEGDFLDATDNLDFMKTNVYSMVYQEELCGFMAGYAAVKLGYTQLGFLGGMAVPAVVRYGYGFLQGADVAAEELGVEVNVNYAYGNQFFGDADITAAMDTWYSAGTEVVFACGGGIYSSAAEAAAKVNGKVIGVDVDQAPIIDSSYGEGMTVTSAQKGLYASTITALTTICEGKWDTLVGKIDTLGIISDDPTLNYVGIPMETTQWSDGFTKDDYLELVKGMHAGTITVSNEANPEVLPETTRVTVNNQGNLK